MKLPVAPPPFQKTIWHLLAQADPAERGLLTLGSLGPAPGGQYRHWDTFRHSPPLEGHTAEAQWVAVKMARRSLYRTLPLLDAAGRPFVYALPNPALEMLHQIDRKAGGNIQGSDQVTGSATRDTYLFKSIVEEAITSSQLEGASTTRRVAKAMIQEGRTPQTKSERMILNNYQAMRRVLEVVDEPLTPGLVLEFQRILTEGTLDEPDAVGRLRSADEHIVVEDETGTILHTPPSADQLEQRMRAMCEFANGGEDGEFMPPAVRAILLHLWLAYDHPFVDGNGRTARALFYWSMARQGYWLCEYVSISRVLRKARGRYARSFLYTESDENDATYFLLSQMRVLLQAIDQLHEYLARKQAELNDVASLLCSASPGLELNPRQIALLNHALRRPNARYTVRSHQTSHGVSYETARSDLLALANAGLLEQRKAGRAFAFTPAGDLHERMRRLPRG